jgi:hypothetical protein
MHQLLFAPLYPLCNTTKTASFQTFNRSINVRSKTCLKILRMRSPLATNLRDLLKHPNLTSFYLVIDALADQGGSCNFILFLRHRPIQALKCSFQCKWDQNWRPSQEACTDKSPHVIRARSILHLTCSFNLYCQNDCSVGRKEKS